MNTASATISTRYHLLDGIRGLCLLSMIAYHGSYDLLHIFHFHLPWLHQAPGYLWQQSICWSFILLSGMCWSLSRNPLKRGLIIFCCGAVISAVTLIFMPSELILFGILTFIGSAMLLMIPLFPMLCHIHAALGLAVSLLLFILFRNLNIGCLGFERWHLLILPASWYRYPLLIPFGFPTVSFASSDYFPLFPWFFLYLAGFFLWQLLQCKKPVLTFCKRRLFLFDTIGRHTLLLYMLHQPILMGIFLLLNRLLVS